MKFVFTRLIALATILISLGAQASDVVFQERLKDTKVSLKNGAGRIVLSFEYNDSVWDFPEKFDSNSKLEGFALSNYDPDLVGNTVVSFQLVSNEGWYFFQWAPIQGSSSFFKMASHGDFSKGYLSTESDHLDEHAYIQPAEYFVRAMVETPSYIENTSVFDFSEVMPWFRKEVYHSENKVLGIAFGQRETSLYIFEMDSKKEMINIVDVENKKVLHSFSGKPFKYLDKVYDGFEVQGSEIYFSETCHENAPIKSLNLTTLKISNTMMVKKENCYVESGVISNDAKKVATVHDEKDGYNIPAIYIGEYGKPEKERVVFISPDDVRDAEYSSGFEIWMFDSIRWSGDSKSIYFDNSGSVACIWKYDLETKGLSKIVPDHAARLPVVYSQNGEDTLAYVVNGKVFIAKPDQF